jgi:hypothetical protein
MSSGSQVGRSVKILVDFISQKTKENIISEYQNNNIDISESDLRRLLLLIEASFNQGLSTGYKEIEEVIKELEKNT